LSGGRNVYETKRQGRIAHHHTDATVPHIVALLGFAFYAAKIHIIFEKRLLFLRHSSWCTAVSRGQ